MDSLRASFPLKGHSHCQLLLFLIWICGIHKILSQKTELKPEAHVPFKFVLADPPAGLFGPIAISPSVIPTSPYPTDPLPPMYPFPGTYEPVLTGKCPVNFSDISDILDKTASDCSAPLAVLVGNVICCPQVGSLLHILQGAYSRNSSRLVLKKEDADTCFSDMISILASRGANSKVSMLCSINPSNLTGGSCPVKDIASFEKVVNTSKLFDACSTVDPYKECCRPVCQPAIMEAALHLSVLDSNSLDSSKLPGISSSIDALSDCKTVVHAWLSMKLPGDSANKAFRMLTSCKVNKVCPLVFKDPSAVINSCQAKTSRNSCCSSMNGYISEIQNQMLITNRQAINCATEFGSILQKGGVMTDIYDLCNIDLKDFSIQANGQQGCLLRSLPEDIIFDNTTGFSFTCDLSDNIEAPWPSSSTLSSLSLCAPEMSLPALPVAQNSAGMRRSHLGGLLPLFLYLMSHIWL